MQAFRCWLWTSPSFVDASPSLRRAQSGRGVHAETPEIRGSNLREMDISINSFQSPEPPPQSRLIRVDLVFLQPRKKDSHDRLRILCESTTAPLSPRFRHEPLSVFYSADRPMGSIGRATKQRNRQREMGLIFWFPSSQRAEYPAPVEQKKKKRKRESNAQRNHLEICCITAIRFRS